MKITFFSLLFIFPAFLIAQENTNQNKEFSKGQVISFNKIGMEKMALPSLNDLYFLNKPQIASILTLKNNFSSKTIDFSAASKLANRGTVDFKTPGFSIIDKTWNIVLVDVGGCLK